MKKKSLVVLGLAVGMSLSLPLLSYAGSWKVDENGWWYQNDDGTYPVNQWEWLDLNNDGIAECYYFNENGYLLMGTTTPDNYTINEKGVWTVDGVIQTKNVEVKTYVVENGMDRYALEGKYYSPEANSYINDTTYQVIRNELFAKLTEKLNFGYLSGHTTYLVCE